GILGAGVGALAHAPGAGLLIGAGTGAALGGLAGAAEDHREQRSAEAAAVAAANRQPPLRLEDVASMAQQHISDDVIINQIRVTGSIYNLTPEQIRWLKEQGVSDRVVIEMQSRIAYQPAPYRRYVIYDPAPPPPVAVGVGFGWGCGH